MQSYRRKVMAAGNLKSDDKQVVTVEKEVVTIVPANPQVIYVPQYEPSSMVVYGGCSSWGCNRFLTRQTPMDACSLR